MAMTKRCTVCKKTKAEKLFKYNPQSFDNRNKKCIDCTDKEKSKMASKMSALDNLFLLGVKPCQ